MRIFSIRVTNEKNNIKIYLETISPQAELLAAKSIFDNHWVHLTSFLAESMNKETIKSLHIHEEERYFYAYDNQLSKNYQIYEVSTLSLALPTNPVDLFQLITRIDTYYHTDNETIFHHILFGKESICNHIKLPKLNLHKSIMDNMKASLFGVTAADLASTLDMTMEEFIAKAPRHTNTNKLIVAEYLSQEITKIMPAFSFLETFKLGYIDLAEEERETIVRHLQALIDTPKKILHALSDQMKLALIHPCLGKKACDGGFYKMSYTELQLLLNADFTMREDGRFSIQLIGNAAFEKWYAPGKPNEHILKDELTFLGKIINLQFAEDSDYHKEVIFTPECTAMLLKHGFSVVTQFEPMFTGKQIVSDTKQTKSNPSNISSSPVALFSEPNQTAQKEQKKHSTHRDPYLSSSQEEIIRKQIMN